MKGRKNNLYAEICRETDFNNPDEYIQEFILRMRRITEIEKGPEIERDPG